MADYKIELGVKLNTKDISTQIGQVEGQIDSIKVNVDAETKELKKKIQEASKGAEIALKIDTSKIESSLDNLSKTIVDIRNSLGTLDSKSGMKDLISSINQMVTALGKAENESDSLVKSLSTLSKKDFSVNIGFSMGKSASQTASEQGDLRRDAISKLKQQATALEDYLNSYYKVAGKYNGVVKLTQGTKAFSSFWELSPNIGNTKISLKQQVSTYKQYIDLMQEAAKIKGIDLSGITSGFSETTDDIVQGTKSATNNVEELKQKFQNLFGSSVDGEKLLAQLDDIVVSLKAIQNTIQALSQNNAINGLTQSFNKLSETLDKLVTNAKLVQDVLGGNVGSGINNSISSTTQKLQNNANVLDTFKRSLQNIGMGSKEIDSVADRIKNLGVQIETINQSKPEKGILSVDISGIDKFGNAVKITEQYSVVTGQLVNKIEKVSTVQQKAGASTNNFVKQQKQAVTNLTNQINKLNRETNDQNAPRAIKDSTHLDTLKTKYKDVISAIKRMENASNDTFVDEQNNVKKLISEYQSLVREIRNAENVATSLRSKDIDTVKGTYGSKLDVLISKMKSSGVYTSGFESGAENLRSVLSNATDASGLVKFLNGLDKLEAGYKRADVAVKEFNRSQKVGINVSGLESKIADIQRISPEIDQFEAKIDGAKVSVKSLLSDLGKVKTQGDFSVVNARFKSFADAAKAAGIAVTEAVAKVSSVNKIKIKIADTGFNGFEQEVQRVRLEAEKLEGVYPELEAALKRLNVAMDGVYSADQAGDVKRLVAANEEYELSLKQVYSQLKLYQQAEKQAYDAEILNQKKASLSSEMEIWLKENSRAAKDFGEEIRRLQASLDGLDANGVKLVGQQFKNITKQAQVMGKTGLTMFDKIKSKLSQYAAYLSVAEIFMYAEQALREIFNTVKEIDTAMTGLYRVTDLTAAEYDSLFNKMISSAKEYGATLNDIINATTDWVRAGFDANTSLGLAEVTTMYQHISDLDYDTAAENLITAYNGFKDELNGAFNGDTVASVNYIADIFNELDNNFAVTSAGLGEALTRSASALDLAGNSIQETAGMITGIVEVTQDPEKAGSALKVLSLRLRGMKGQLEELGEETDENVENISKMQGQILNMTGGKVNIFDASGDFKSTYEIMQGIAEVWDDLSSIDQANLLETIAGKNRANDVAALLSNWENVESAVKSATEAEGSAARENAKYVDSIQGRLDKLTTTWQSFANTFMSSDFLKGAVSGLTSFVEGLEKIIDTVGTFPALMTTIATGFSLFKNGGLFKTFNNNLDGFINKIGIANKSFADLSNAFKSGSVSGGLKGFFNGLSAMKNSLSGSLTKTDIANIQAYNKEIKSGTSVQTAWYRTMQTSSKSAQDLVASANGSKVALNGMKTATIGSKVALIGAKVAAVAFNAALTMGISLLINWAVSGIQKLVNAKKDLAEKVDEITSKFKEQSKELQKLKGDYDTTNESSMISKYEKLSKGVDGLGRNVSLTIDEYSEYQSIVNQIADQIPSLVSGYDSQGNAILSCKGNVEELTEAYEKLIHAQNQEILSTSAGDIENDWQNTLRQADGYDIWEKIGNLWSFDGFFGGKLENYDMKTSTAKWLSGLTSDTTAKEINKFLDKDLYTQREVIQALQNAGYDVNAYSNIGKILEDALENEPEKIKSILDNYYAGFDDAVAEYKTKATALLSEAFDISSSISGLNYGNISEELQTIAYQTVNSLDFDFLNNLTEQGKTLDQWTKELLNQLNAVGKVKGEYIEDAFELQTQFNGGDIDYGDYIDKLREVESVIDGLDLKDEAKTQLKISLGLDENGVVDQYDALIKRLTTGAENSLGLDATAVKKFVDDLSTEEFSTLVKILPDLDAGTTLDEIQSLIDDQLAQEFKFDIKIQTEGIEALNTALAESRSAAGMTAESIEFLKARYEDLDGFNAAALFEKTANGIRLNNDELSRLEEQYVNTNKLEIDKNLNTLVEKYQDVNNELKTNTSLTADERKELEASKESLADKIDELSTLASQYDGLTSAFTKWQNALNGAEEGDNYDSVFENLEAMNELDDKGLVGTDKYKTFAQLMSYEDLSTASIDEIGDAFDKGYKKAERYFTEGQKGSKNFLNDLHAINSEWAHINKDGVWEVDINAEEAAKKLGISVEAVLLILDKLKDYGIKVEVEDSSVNNLQTKIQETEAKLKELGQSPVDINVDIEANSSNLGKIESEIEKAKSKIAEINNSSVSPEVKTAQLEDARAKLEALIQKKQEASQPAFMNLNTSQVNASLVDALEKIKEYQNALNELNKLQELKEAGIAIDDSEIAAAEEKLDGFAKAIQGLDGDVKVAIGLEEDGSIDSIHKAFADGKVKIDANTDPALTKIEQLAENVERIEDKDVAINVTVNGLDQVKELNKQIDLATNIKGDVDKLSEYVESAKELNKLGNNITSYVTAEVKGNVIDTREGKLDNLKVFGESAKEVKGLGTFTSKVTADVKGNVIETKESKLDNLKVFTDNAKDISEIGVVKSTVTADIKGNVADTKEYKIDNLKVFTDNAKDISKIGVVTSKVVADIDGNVIDTKESKIDNLKIFTDSAKDVRNISNVESKVSANIEGNVINTREGKLDNLKVFTDNAKDIKKIGNVESTVNANIEGNVKNTREGKIDNLKVFTDSAKDISKIGDVKSTVTAEVNGNVIETREGKLDNLKVFTDNAKDIKNIGNVSSKVTAEINGNVIETREGKLDNLKVFTDSAKNLKNIGSVNSDVNANIDGNVINTKEIKLDNLKVFADGANELKNTGSFESKVVANIDGNIIDTKEMKIDNLGVFADNAKKLKDIGSFKSNVEANVNGNITDTRESKIDNLKAFYDSAKDLKDIGSFESSVKANVDGNVINTKEMKIDNLKVFSDSAKDLKSIGAVTSKVTADVGGNVLDTRENKIDNLKVYYESAKDISKIGTVNSSVSASISGNVIDTREGKINNLKVFSDSAKNVKNVGSPTSNVTANVNGNVINTSEDKIDNLGVFATNANKLKNTGNFTSSVAANVSGNVITDNSVNSDLEHFASIVSGMSSQTVTVSVNANVDSANINNAIDLLTKVANSGVFKDYKATVQVGAKIATIDDTTVKNYNAPPKEGKVSYSVNPESSVYTWTAPSKDGVVNYSASVEALTDAQKHKTGTITYKANIIGFGGVVNGTANANGSAFANGTSGKAFKQGDWGVKKTTTALTGELGQELVVYKNRWYTVGDNGAEFATIPKGAIVFNHKQTEELFKNGKVTSDGGRGRALSSGTAFASGTAFEGGSGMPKDETDTDKFEETFDWIDILLSRLERTIDNLDKTVNNAYKSWSDRNNALESEIIEVGKLTNQQFLAYNTYFSKANKVGLDESWASKVRNGTIDVDTITDENLAEKIKEYQEWYEKALECKDAFEDLKQTESELYEQRFENVQSYYDGIIQGFEHTESMLNEYISQAEAKGYIVSKNYYQALIDNEKNNIDELQKEQSDLITKRDEAVASGAIVKGSQAWYDMCSEIDGVTQAIEEGTTALIEYDNAMRNIDWEVFDLIQERISDVTEEANFLIDLMSYDKLFDDNGKLTDKGMATMGLHGQNYNTYMYAADEYGKEVAELNKQIAKDPYDQELINRRNELLELQRESILAAEDEKQAIKDLVEDGINLELDALQELIDKKNEELESEKDLYEYQKKVKEQTEEIASLEKQMAAYSGDNSEEARAKVQELKVSLEDAKTNLEETEYDKYLSDTQQMLDTLYDEYELTLNARLDNLDYLVQGVIDAVNIAAGIDRMVDDVDKDAITKVNSNKTTTAAKKNPTTTSTKKKATTTNKTSSTGDGKAKIGDKVTFLSGKYYYDSQGKTPLGSKNHGKQVYITNINTKSWATHPYHISTGKKLGSGDLGWLKLNQISGYATGKKNFLDNEIAWTQENGKEFIVRPSDGAILTPIAKGDSVLNAQASGNIWNMANNPAEFIKDSLKLDATNIPNGSSVNNSCVQNFENITFSMPNVRNYEQLVSEMQRDPKFEKLILAMTLDQVAGKSKLSKNKAIR